MTTSQIRLASAVGTNVTRTFSHLLWKRLIIVDGDGIHEHRRGRCFASIRWQDLRRLDHDVVRGERGAKITVRLSEERKKEFFNFASAVWREHHKDRWEHNRQRRRRLADLSVYLWMPMLTFGSIAFLYAFAWWLGWPASFQPIMERAHGLAIFAAISQVVVIALHSSTRRRNQL